MHNVYEQLEHVTQQREAAAGDPAQGPYPATVGEVADEIVAWVEDAERRNANGLRHALIVRLHASLQMDPVA